MPFRCESCGALGPHDCPCAPGVPETPFRPDVIQCPHCGFTVPVPKLPNPAAAWRWADDWLASHFCDRRRVAVVIAPRPDPIQDTPPPEAQP